MSSKKVFIAFATEFFSHIVKYIIFLPMPLSFMVLLERTSLLQIEKSFLLVHLHVSLCLFFCIYI